MRTLVVDDGTPFDRGTYAYMVVEMARQEIRFYRRDHPEAAPSWDLMEAIGAKLYGDAWTEAFKVAADVLREMPPELGAVEEMTDLAALFSTARDQVAVDEVIGRAQTYREAMA